MTRKSIAFILLASLLSPAALPFDGSPNGAAAAPTASSAVSAPRPSSQEQSSSKTESQTKARKRSYERETSERRHSGISKQEFVFLAAIAGTSMGIGALAGGGKGVAIGAIVGGWGAYVGHRFWKWMRK